MSGRLQGRIAIVTGASSGLGRAMAVRYANEGARVVCADLVPEGTVNVPFAQSTWTLLTPFAGSSNHHRLGEPSDT